MWHAFLDGYRSRRQVAPADERAIHLFVPIRHMWLMGEYAGRTAERGTELLSAAWLERELAFLLAWERERLSPTLL
jgi:Ser/Thr protein kinase RdoA (MazF antagonist)